MQSAVGKTAQTANRKGRVVKLNAFNSMQEQRNRNKPDVRKRVCTKKRMSLIFVAVALLASLLLIPGASANTGKVMQELEYRDIRVSLDGEVLDLRNAIGEKVEPFMFGGTNYLPVRALAEALGLDVAWDGKEVMVVLTTPKAPASEPETAPVTTAASDAIDCDINDCHITYLKRKHPHG